MKVFYLLIFHEGQWWSGGVFHPSVEPAQKQLELLKEKYPNAEFHIKTSPECQFCKQGHLSPDYLHENVLT